MLPGFTAFGPAAALESQGAAAAIWEDPKPPKHCDKCIPIRTDTSCILVSLWCTDVFWCCDHEESRTPYPCGVCFGADW